MTHAKTALGVNGIPVEVTLSHRVVRRFEDQRKALGTDSLSATISFVVRWYLGMQKHLHAEGTQLGLMRGSTTTPVSLPNLIRDLSLMQAEGRITQRLIQETFMLSPAMYDKYSEELHRAEEEHWATGSPEFLDMILSIYEWHLKQLSPQAKQQFDALIVTYPTGQHILVQEMDR